MLRTPRGMPRGSVPTLLTAICHERRTVTGCGYAWPELAKEGGAAIPGLGNTILRFRSDLKSPPQENKKKKNSLVIHAFEAFASVGSILSMLKSARLFSRKETWFDFYILCL